VVDARRHMVAIGSRAAEERSCAGCAVPGRQPGKTPLDLQFAGMRRQVGEARATRALRHIAEQRIDIVGADDRQHVPAVVRRQGQITHGVRASLGKLHRRGGPSERRARSGRKP
jgi:hypothetical protein